MTLETLDSAIVKSVFAAKPYGRFPVAEAGQLRGILLRSEMEAAEAEKRPVRLVPAFCARPGQSIRECQALLIESGCGMIIITDQAQGLPLAVVTLHDLLRAQTSISEREGQV